MKSTINTKINILLVVLSFIVIGCGESEKPGTSSPEIKQVSGIEKEFQDTMEKMESLKADIEKHNDIYTRAVTKSRSILDNREAIIAAEECLRYSEALYTLCINSMNNNEVIRRVSGSSKTYQDYKDFSNIMSNKYKSILNK